MELLPVLFFVGVLTYLNWPKKPPDKPSPEKKFADAVKEYLESGIPIRTKDHK
ncbi:MAG: hypothetical protein O3C67_01415 [Cyanobacteria bacterium]|nr:hypothetical protein [Cyanobacteriota bacterium]MDA0867752.1 hypothetical protein [Cyanobacteriota bacterium]